MPITFGKTYISKIPVQNIKTGKKELFDFVQYEPKDVKQIEETSKKWGKYTLSGGYAEYIANDIKKDDEPDIKFYGLEDSDKKIQAICEIQSHKMQSDVRKNRINFIAANPEHIHSSKTRKYSKLGTSLFREIVKFAKQDNADSIGFDDYSEGFWDTMPCITRVFHSSFTTPRVILSEDYDECLRKLDKMI